MPARLSIGDVIEVICPPGVAYVSYAGRDSNLGPAIWVIPRIFSESQKDWRAVFSLDGYFVFYAVYTGIKNKHMHRVGHSIDAIRELPGLRRIQFRVIALVESLAGSLPTESRAFPRAIRN
jgi:hypothetical protein